MKILSGGNSLVWAVRLVVDDVWGNQPTRQIYYLCSECSTLFFKVLHISIKRVIYFHSRQRTGTTRRVTTDELTFELISNLFFHLSAVIWCLTNSIFLPKVYAIFNDVFSVWRDHYFATLLNLSHKDIFLQHNLQHVTLCARNFSSAVSSFCQVFIVIRPKRTADVFLVVAKTRTKSIQKQIKSIDVDKVGNNNPLTSKSCFV